MAIALCAVDESAATPEAVRAAIDYCRTHNRELKLVGIVKPMLGVTQPAYGERVRRFREVEFALVQAARAARGAGLDPGIMLRAGDPGRELLREADTVGAEEVFLGRTRSLLAATLMRRPRVSVLRIARTPANRRDVTRVFEHAA